MITVVGFPSPIGGADTELYHTVKIWRKHLDVSVRCVGEAPPREDAKQWLKDIGVECEVYEDGDIPFNTGDIFVGFCNPVFLRMAPRLREGRAKMIWANCMCFAFPDEKEFVKNYGPFDIHMMQSVFQQESLVEALGVQIKDNCRLQRGAFDFENWEFNPKPHRNDIFTVGRLARPDAAKWSSSTYGIYGRIQYPNVHAWFMGMDQKIHDKLGPAPAWATCIPPAAISSQDFYKHLHCLMPINGGAMENWPRVGLEAMACGVPIVTQREWGWKEMIVDGATGFLAGCDEELAHKASVLAWDENLRMIMAREAREYLENTLAKPETIAKTWKGWFDNV